MEINLTKAGESVKSIAVTGTPTGGSETTYTMTCTDAQSIAEKTAFYLSVAAGNYNKIVITDSEDKVCTLTAASGITVAANHIKPLTFADSKLDFKPNLPSGALPGVFTVSDDDGKTTKQIYFSQETCGRTVRMHCILRTLSGNPLRLLMEQRTQLTYLISPGPTM